MGCRIGMAVDVAARVQEHKDAGRVPQNATYRTLNSGLTYDEAQTEENRRRAACGPHCAGGPGGGVFNVYNDDSSLAGAFGASDPKLVEE